MSQHSVSRSVSRSTGSPSRSVAK
ncbi:hypothetical protein Q048_05257, partial [Pseudomonas aeruginosa BWHPSA043]